jgi:putative solute:sodium symporter small subunit
MSNDHEERKAKLLKQYWRQNLILMGLCLIVWATVSYGCGILWAERLNEMTFLGTGYPLGFWFAHQGAILTFVFVILVYALAMNRVDAIHHRLLDELDAEFQEGAGE